MHISSQALRNLEHSYSDSLPRVSMDSLPSCFPFAIQRNRMEPVIKGIRHQTTQHVNTDHEVTTLASPSMLTSALSFGFCLCAAWTCTYVDPRDLCHFSIIQQ